MKRSKIFLGITTGVLAVAGVAAAKLIPSVHRFYCTQITNTHYCEPTVSLFAYTSTDPGSGNLITTVVTKSGGSTATVPVYTKGTKDQICSSSNCLHQLVDVGN